MPLPRRLWGLREGFPSFGPAWGGRKALEALPVPGSMASLQTGAPHTQPPLAVWKHCAPEALTQASGVVELLRGGHKDMAALWGPPDVPVTERPPPRRWPRSIAERVAVWSLGVVCGLGRACGWGSEGADQWRGGLTGAALGQWRARGPSAHAGERPGGVCDKWGRRVRSPDGRWWPASSETGSRGWGRGWGTGRAVSI